MATEVDALAREPHHAAHLYSTWLALPKSLRGKFYVHPRMLDEAKAAGVEAIDVQEAPNPGPLTLVASYRDLKWARDLGRLVIYSEHGAGQSYAGVKSGSYIGAIDRAGVVGVLVPGHDAARRHTAVHPTIPTFPVGCPKLDRWHGVAAPSGRPVVAISHHWDCNLCPETKGAFRFYKGALPKLAEEFDLIGHAHPRLLPILKPEYERVGIEVVRDFDEVIERATVFCIDNSSTMYEWAALDRPVVVLNAPWYRRKVNHGLRFWSHADVGPMVNGPKELSAAIHRAIEDPPEVAARRREIVADVYAAVDGKGAPRAAAAVKALAKEWG